MNGVPIPTQVSARAAEIGRLTRRWYGSASDWLMERVFPHIVNYAKKQQATHHREVKRLHTEHSQQIAALHETVRQTVKTLTDATPRTTPPTA